MADCDERWNATQPPSASGCSTALDGVEMVFEIVCKHLSHMFYTSIVMLDLRLSENVIVFG